MSLHYINNDTLSNFHHYSDYPGHKNARGKWSEIFECLTGRGFFNIVHVLCGYVYVFTNNNDLKM